MTRRVLCGGLAALGLALYLWPALTAPVVLWSDSQTDLEWARAGRGILSPAGTVEHGAKPGYLLFLRAALASGGDAPRGVVVLQSLLLAAAIMASSVLVGRRYGFGVGVVLYAIQMFFLRSRDAASAVMSEPLAAAAFLLVVVLLVKPPRTMMRLAVLGGAIGALFLVRPNIGAIAAVLALLRLALDRHWRGLIALAAASAAIVLPLWLATSGGREAAPRGLAFQLLEASADDFWTPGLGWIPRDGEAGGLSREWRARALSNWRVTLAHRGPDAVRQIGWRLTHGLIGTEYYDATWSPAYQAATTVSRIASPVLILFAIALLLVLPLRGPAFPIKAMGLCLVALALMQNLVIGSLPRYVLPLLPTLLALGVCAAASLRQTGPWRLAAAAALLCSAILVARRYPSGLSWEWGRIEAAGVSISQELPRGSLPARSPATLHVRIASPLVPTSAGLEVRTAGGVMLQVSRAEASSGRPEITIPLPQSFLDASRRGPVSVTLVSTGAYGPNQYLLFPVIPRPWRAPARREESAELSPSTGVASGALDWWAHPGAP